MLDAIELAACSDLIVCFFSSQIEKRTSPEYSELYTVLEEPLI